MTADRVPMAVPEISGAEAELANRLCALSGRIEAEIGGKRFRLAFPPAFEAPYRPALRVILGIGEGRAVLDLETVPLPELLGYPEGGLDPRDIPAPVLLAYLEGALGALRERAARRLGRDIVLAEAVPAGGRAELDPADHVLHLEFHAAAPGGEAREPVRGRLHFAREESAALAAALPAAPPRGEDGAGPPVPIRFRVGCAALMAAECADLEAGDIVLLSEDPMARGGIRVCAGDPGRPLWKATWYEGKITIEEECEEDMPMGDAEPQGSGADRLEALEVRLTFDLGSRPASLAELRGLAPGSVLVLPENPDARVAIRAGGKAIGTGTLIMVDGRAGVRVDAIREGTGP